MSKVPSIDHREAIHHLAEADPILGDVIARVGPFDVVPNPRIDLFQSLLRSIIYQQLHGNAAAAIHGRVVKVIGARTLRAASLQAVSDDSLRAAGLSANKLLAIRDLAAKSLDGTVPTARVAAGMSDDEIIERLTAVRGIGPWTVHMLLIFHLGRPDVLPTGDFSVRQAFSRLYKRGRKVTPQSLTRHAKRWQPYRSIASWYLWRSLDLVPPATVSK